MIAKIDRRRSGVCARVPRFGDSRLSMEGRMTVCNVDRSRRAGRHDRPDQTTFDYVQGREKAQRTGGDDAVAYWKTLFTDDDAEFDAVVDIDTLHSAPFVTWGTNPARFAVGVGAVG